MKRPPATPSVNLFPFLAVLVCTMGALILLLLVTTSRIRTRIVTASIAVAESDIVTEPNSISELVPAPPWRLAPSARPPKPTPPEAPDYSQLHEQWRQQRQVEWEEYERQRRSRLEQQRLLQEDYQRRLAAVNDERSRAEQELTNLRANAAALQQNDFKIANESAELQKLLAAAQAALAETTTLIQRKQRQLEELSVAAEELEGLLQELQSRPAVEITDFEVVGFHGSSRTKRKPILIECRETSITFAVERIQLTPDDLSGFTAAHNPARAGCEALVDYWRETGQMSPNEEPYILLLVRPQGTVAFYVARQLLSEMNLEFGYELIADQKPFQYGDPDPVAVKRCQQAIDAVLSERARLAARLRTGRLPVDSSLQFADAQGRFALHEVQTLRESVEDTGPGTGMWRSPHRQEHTNEGNPLRRPMPSAEELFGEFDAQADSAESQPRKLKPYQPQPLPGETSVASNGNRAAEVARRNQPFGSGNSSGKGRQIDPAEEISDLVSQNQQGKIGIERGVEIHLWSDKIRIGEDPALALTADATSDVLTGLVEVAVLEHLQAWDPAPDSFFWRPVVTFIVHPGGNVTHARLRHIGNRWNTKTRVEYVLN